VGRVLKQWAEVRPDLDVSAVGVIARMARIRAIVDAQQAQLFGPAGITPADFPVLVSLRRRHAPYRMTHTQLATELGLTPGTVTSRVDHLVGLGLVRRQTATDDARIRWVILTDAGLDLTEDLIPRHLEVEEDLLAGISDTRRQRLANDLAALLADLESRYR